MAGKLDRIVEQYHQELRQFVLKRVTNRFDAEDVLQNMWIKVVGNQNKLADVSHVRGWLFQIVRSTIIDFYRKRTVEIPDVNVPDTPINDMEHAETNFNEDCGSYLLRELRGLHEKYQLPFWLYVGEEWKHRQISSELNLTLSGSKTRVQRARRQLKEILLNCCDVQFDAYGNVVRYEKRNVCCA
ncbi:sigma-70 family RNA polymerase sigma factor [Salipaludibacillus aurantiacus]|uniref:RNA polymerase sigma-70 factor, ECF subfamily n=1 Tax=Salipaludibacillus aurantiacus TaxID=1601833 RepID=A0A1H9W8D6_9BACI|nr:sigma-70 family RNA polymerase sigma factor [Salipaludibacillus aurantiacus]SES30051.1 RNA polymerase sigma-70 factor, ECF subfamily [Salipaludibacillus aurantiacus]